MSSVVLSAPNEYFKTNTNELIKTQMDLVKRKGVPASSVVLSAPNEYFKTNTNERIKTQMDLVKRK